MSTPEPSPPHDPAHRTVHHPAHGSPPPRYPTPDEERGGEDHAPDTGGFRWGPWFWVIVVIGLVALLVLAHLTGVMPQGLHGGGGH